MARNQQPPDYPTEQDREQQARWPLGAAHPSIELVENSLPGEERESMRRYKAFLWHVVQEEEKGR